MTASTRYCSGVMTLLFRASMRQQQLRRPLLLKYFMPNARFISSENEKHFHELGYLDERGLTVFDTLHEMQFRSCQVYAQNDLFGTYNPKSDKFEYMTFEEFSQKVHECRAVLKDLGAMVLLFHEIIRYLYI
jgi:hypothetical protein